MPDPGLEERLKTLAHHFHVSIRGLAARLDMPYRTLHNYVTGRTSMPIQAAERIAAVTGARTEWLLLGSGPMFGTLTHDGGARHDARATYGGSTAVPSLPSKVIELQSGVPALYRAANQIEDAQLGEGLRALIRVFLSPDVDPIMKGKVLGFIAAVDPGEKKSGLVERDDATRLGSAAGRKADR